MTARLVLAIDQGTTSTRALLFDSEGRTAGEASRELTQHYPQPGWVEHDAEEIWQTVAAVVPAALAKAGARPQDVAAIGVTNQRETSIIWERRGGRPVAPAVVWQDRRTQDFCRQHQADEPWLFARTGLVLDPYFSATKIRWVLDREPGLRLRAEGGGLVFGTVDSFLVWRLTGGRVHATDVSNASRTLLLNLETAAWDDELCRYFSVPRALLPEIRPSSADYGTTHGLDFLPDGLPIGGVAGDQQAALFGQGGFEMGQAKCTYGTGAFFLMHTGDRPIRSQRRLISSVAATTGPRPQYVLEGSVFVAGAAVQWLRDGLKLFAEAADVEALAGQSDPEQSTLLVPAFVGLGAPHWVPEARGVLFGLARETSAADLARGTLEGVAFQVADLIDAAVCDVGRPLEALRVDGGMSRNHGFLQIQADVLGLPVIQARHSESTALGAAFLAGLHAGVWDDLDCLRRLAGDARRFNPRLPDVERARRLAQWRRAVQAVIAYYQG